MKNDRDDRDGRWTTEMAQMANIEYHGEIIDVPNVHYTISFLGEFVDWDVRHFFKRITTFRIIRPDENKR